MLGIGLAVLTYFESEGLVRPSLNLRGGQEAYTPEDVARVREILHLIQDRSMTVPAVKIFLGQKDVEKGASGERRHPNGR